MVVQSFDGEESSRYLGEEGRFRMLLSMQQRLGGVRVPDELLPLLTQEVTRLLDADRGTVYWVDWDRRELRSHYAMGLREGGIVIPLNMGVAGLCVLNNAVCNVGDAYQLPFFNPAVDRISGYRTESILAAPFGESAGHAAGAVQLLNKNVGRFTNEDEATLAAEAAAFARSLGGEPPQAAASLALLQRLKERIGCDRGSLFLLDLARFQLVSVVADGLAPGAIRIDMNVGVAGYVALTGQPLLVQEASIHPYFNSATDGRTGYLTDSLLCVPMFGHSGEVIGVVQVINKTDGEFSREDQEIITVAASVFAILMENAVLLSEHDAQFKSILSVLAASIDAKDALTAGHSQRVAEYSVGIAKILGCTSQEIDVVHVAAMLHDYGKLAIEDQVLKKPGKLTLDEYERIKLHVNYTLSILEKIHFSRKYRQVPFIAAAHHEHMDGSGYAVGLRGREISFLTKIITVADVFEALTADRHYRPAMTHEEAFALLDQGVGSKFDASVVAALRRHCAAS